MRTFEMRSISAQDIVDTVREGLVVLDADLAVVSANRCFYDLFSVAPEETVGRRVYDLGDGQWDIPDLRRLLEEILPQESAVEGYEVDHVFPGVGRKVIHLNARKVYREGNHVEHLLVTFYDVTALRKREIEARRAAEIARTIVDTIRDPLVILDADLRIVTASRNFVAMFGDAEADVVGLRIDELNQGQWDVQALTRLLERVVPDESPFDGFLVEDEFPGLGHRVFKLNARKIFVPGNHVTNLLLAFEDVTDAVAADRHREVLAAELAHRVKNSLQVISAFVSFEVRRAAEPCREGYLAMQARINAVANLYDVIARSAAFGPVDCQTAFKFDPLSASKIDPLRRWLLARSERIGAGGEEEIGPGAFCAGRAQRRCLKRQLSLPVSTMSQWWVRRSSSAVVILASPKTDGHSPNAKFVVTITEVCS